MKFKGWERKGLLSDLTRRSAADVLQIRKRLWLYQIL